MPEYRIEEMDDGVKVEVDDVQAQQQEDLLQAFSECQAGT